MVKTTSRYAQVVRQLTPFFLATCVALSALVARPSGAQGTSATVIDRFGNRHELTAIRIKNRTQLDYYVGDERRSAPFDHVQKLVVDGQAGDEERPVKVHLRSGRVDAGRLFTGGSGTSTHQDVGDGFTGGGARAPTGVSGKTSLGPWMLSLDDVREVRFLHPVGTSAPDEPQPLKAAVVTTPGGLFEVTDLLVTEKQILRYMRDRQKMTLNLAKVDRIQFAEFSSGQEQRPITITLWSGKMIHGSVVATTARYSGETDKQYARRTGAAVTGKLAAGTFSAGLHEIKLIRFHPVVKEPEPEGETPQPVGN